MTIHIATPDQLPEAARQFIDSLGQRRVVAFHAPMGAGKTTFISAIVRQLGVEEPATSPTFAIVNEYQANGNANANVNVNGNDNGNGNGNDNANGNANTPSSLIPHLSSVVYHLDLYRLRSLEEAADIGLEDYLYSGAYCFVEWPDLAEPLLPEDTCHVNITVNPDGSRDIEF